MTKETKRSTEEEKEMTAELLVPQQSQIDDQEYGILMYDIPEDHQTLYFKIQSRIRRRAIRLNLSVWLFKWGMKEELEQLIEEAKQEVPNQTAVVFMAKFDNSSHEDLRVQARACLLRDLKQLGERLLKKITEAKEKAEEKGERFDHLRTAYLKEMKKRLEEAEALAMLFCLTHDTKHAFESTQKIFASEFAKVLAEEDGRRASRKASRTIRRARKSAEENSAVEPGKGWSENVQP